MKKVDWSGVVGHKKVKQLFDVYFRKNRLPHSLILCGVSGVGKKLVAGRVARTLMCKEDGPACNFCFNCKMWELGEGENPLFFSGENQITIEMIRNLKNELSRTDLLSGYRVVVIDDIERMTKEAANAVLKLMEEPKSRVVFIGITGNIKNVIGTIVSRSVVLYFNRLTRNESASFIAANHNRQARETDLDVMMGIPGIYERYARTSREAHLKNVINFWRLYCANSAIKINFISKVSKAVPGRLLGLLTFWETCVRDYLAWMNKTVSYRWYDDENIDSIYSKMSMSPVELMSLLDKIEFLRTNINRGLNKKVQLYNILNG